MPELIPPRTFIEWIAGIGIPYRRRSALLFRIPEQRCTTLPPPPIAMADGNFQKLEIGSRPGEMASIRSPRFKPELLCKDMQILKCGRQTELSAITTVWAAMKPINAHVIASREEVGVEVNKPTGEKEGSGKFPIGIAEARAVIMGVGWVWILLVRGMTYGEVENSIPDLRWKACIERAVALRRDAVCIDLNHNGDERRVWLKRDEITISLNIISGGAMQ